MQPVRGENRSTASGLILPATGEPTVKAMMSTQPQPEKALARVILYETPENPNQGLKQLGNQPCLRCCSEGEGFVIVLGRPFKCTEANAKSHPQNYFHLSHPDLQKRPWALMEQPFKSCPDSRQKPVHAICHIAVHTSARNPCQLGQA